MFVLSANIDLREVILRAIGKSIHILVFLSAIVIILKLNPRGYYSTSVGYPVFFDFIGIPGRNYGIFSHPNTLGQAAALSTLFMIESKMKKIYLLVPLLCIIKCGSRTSILGIITGLLVFITIRILRSNASPKAIKKYESPLAVGTFVLGILLASSAQFLNYINFLDPQALTNRVQIWQVSLNLFKSSSTFGLGWGWSDRAIESQLLNIWAVSAHNAILEIIFSAGIAGVIIFLFLLSKLLVYFNNLQTLEKALITSILVSGISESYIDLQYPTNQTFLYFMIVLSANSKRKVDHE
jgi:O-antigen ligase